MLYKDKFIAGKPKRTSIGNGRRKRTLMGRTKRSSRQKIYRGQGKR